MVFRRLAMVFSIAICGSLALAAAGLAAGGGLGPGTYVFTSTGANAYFGAAAKGGPAGPTFTVSVNQGLNSFQPMHPKGPRTVFDSTMVFVSEFDATGAGGFGCFVVPDAAFTVAKDLQSAALHTTLTAAEACPGYGTPVAAGKDVAAYAGGGGGATLALPINVDVSWTGNGVVSTNKNRFSFQCMKYSEDGTNSNRDSSGGASGTISSLPGSFTADFADVSAAASELDISGTSQPQCFGY
jgi:hypothetical protein